MALAPGRPELNATKPVKPELDVALVEADRIAKPWWDWLDQFWRWYRFTTTTADRPTRLTKADAGFAAFDITLNQPIWWNGTAWIEIAGGGGGGGVSSVSGTAPVVSSGGANPAISMPAATGSVNGYLKSADWTTFNGKEPPIGAGTTSQWWRGDKSWQSLPAPAWGSITGVPSTFPPSAHVHPQSDVTDLVSDLALKAPLASPAFTGNPTAPTPTAGDNDMTVATTAFVTTAVSAAGGFVDAPSDGGEYTRINGTWRLKEQTFDIGGLTAKDIAVPSGARLAQINGSIFVPASAGTLLRVSADGATFFAGASDYIFAGSALNTGTGLYQAVAQTTATGMYLMLAADNTAVAQQFDALMMITRASTAPVFTLKADGRHRDAGAAILYRGWHGTGWVQSATTTALALQALRVLLSSGSAFGAGSTVTVTWMY